MERNTRSEKFPIGSILPVFQLLNVNGEKIGSDYLTTAKAALVVFSCNHCPYVQGSDALLIDIVKQFEPQGLRTVAINSNDASQYPEDSYKKMQEKAVRLTLPFPYLYDETQEVAHKFDAACTPECFLFDANHHLAYQGAITDRPRDASAQRRDLLSPALEAVLGSRSPEPNFNHPIGCSIKWK